MTKEEAENEMRKVIIWAVEEGKMVTERLKKSGKYRQGLDANNKEYAYIDREAKKRLNEIKKKYQEK